MVVKRISCAGAGTLTKSERLSTDERDRLDQELDDVSQRLAEQTAALTATLPPEPVAEPAPPKRNRGALPAHLPRVDRKRRRAPTAMMARDLPWTGHPVLMDDARAALSQFHGSNVSS
jgi:hypothetical protein